MKTLTIPLTLSVKEWFQYIALEIEKNNPANVLAIKKNITDLTGQDDRNFLCQLLYESGWRAFNEARIKIAEEFFYWLEELDQRSWPAQLAGAMLRQKNLGRTEATRQFRQFVTANPVFYYQHSNEQNAIKIGVLLTTGNTEIDFISGGFTLPSGLTECQHLTNSPQYSVAMLFIEGIAAKDIEAFDCIINAISDCDLHHEQLLHLEKVLTSVNKPIINHPRFARLNSRDYLYRHINRSTDIICPRQIKVNLESTQQTCLLDIIKQHNLNYPLLIRPAGTQNGQGFILLKNESEARNYPITTGAYYLSEYFDFKSKDGFYRKYRCWVIGDDIVLNHLFIGDNWNVHGSYRFELMIKNQWMVDEEKSFLHKNHENCIEAIAKAVLTLKSIINLDYFGIDFALTEHGKIIIFEANATMRSYYPEWAEAFPYMTELTDKHINSFHALISKKILSKKL